MLSYSEALKCLLEYPSHPKLDLSRVQELLGFLGHPERVTTFFHVAGTNGKGSTCAALYAMLQAAKIPCGMFTSPHLTCARERISLNGEMISEELFCVASREVHKAVVKMVDPPTFFEAMTAMAFWVFANQKVSAAVIEVGVGGRLDFTNVITPCVSGITHVGLDHMHFLGNTVELIAKEKAGIIKPTVPVVFDGENELVANVIKNIAAQNESQAVEIGKDVRFIYEDGYLEVFTDYKNLLRPTKIALQGQFQARNMAVAVAMMDIAGFVPNLEVRKHALENVRWPGRYECVSQDPIVILDGAHNASAFEALLKSIKQDKRLQRPCVLVMGATNGHDIGAMVHAWKTSQVKTAQVIATRSISSRSYLANEVAKHFFQICDVVYGIDNVKDAVDKAMQTAKEIEGYVLVTGSLFVVGEARTLFVDVPDDKKLPLY